MAAPRAQKDSLKQLLNSHGYLTWLAACLIADTIEASPVLRVGDK